MTVSDWEAIRVRGSKLEAIGKTISIRGNLGSGWFGLAR